MVPESKQNGIKIVLKWCPKGVEMEPAAKEMLAKLQNCTKSREGAVFANVARPFLDLSGDPEGFPKSVKN